MADNRLRYYLNKFIPLIITAILTVLFFISPLQSGDDWRIFREAALRIPQGINLYQTPTTYSNFSYAPWLAVAILPFSLLPLRWGWAVLSSVGLVIIMLLAKHYHMSGMKLVMMVLSPPIFYTILHGQVDLLVLSGLLLPPEWWIIVGLTKPQTVIGLSLGAFQGRILKVIMVTGVILLGSFLFFGLWPIELLTQPKPYFLEGHNIWRGLWPLQLPVGVAIIIRGIEKKDERYFLASSPFFLPYSTVGNLVGIWLVVCTAFKEWQIALVLIVWWFTVLYRM
jgi:hypothetical protein